jgi:hypothetical protein
LHPCLYSGSINRQQIHGNNGVKGPLFFLDYWQTYQSVADVSSGTEGTDLYTAAVAGGILANTITRVNILFYQWIINKSGTFITHLYPENCYFMKMVNLANINQT